MNAAKAVLPVFLLTIALGCGSEPDDEVFGTFTLVGVEGSPLPYLESSDAECDQFISEGELRLLPNRTYSLEFSGPYDCSRGGGQVNPLEAFVTAPPIPPATGPDLTLQFAIVP